MATCHIQSQAVYPPTTQLPPSSQGVSFIAADGGLFGSWGHSPHQSPLTAHGTQLTSSLRHVAREETALHQGPLVWVEPDQPRERYKSKGVENSNLMVGNIGCLEHGGLRRASRAEKGTVKMLFKQAGSIESRGI